MGAPRINALQKLWLREIGIEKTWLPIAESPAIESDSDARSQLMTAGRPASSGSPRSYPTGAPAARSSSGPASDSTASTALPTSASPGAPSAASPGAHPTAAPAPRPAAAPPSRPVASPPIAVASAELLAGASVSTVEIAAAAPDLDGLRAQVEVCTACQLCQGRRHAVFGMGARPARWMIIGEAPGEQEDRRGLPFVGRSGQLLDAMLRSVGMSRDENVFIANVIKCRPPGNRNPKPEEIAACSPYLKRQIEMIQPERILVVGRFAAQTLLGTDATIGNLRGRQHVWTTEAGVRIPVIVSYHPAYLLRSPLEKARAWQDLQLAVASTV
ncbi:uracil-DNA glycosylase family protein [Bordetella sp. 15P40C-2]|uniref:uracil-DNA glycosylase n=1 Tax=Bordetella sp. 15P40C-2 TaxID=2572246 RepID=UPI0013234B56|nr:uracil-DNA glycosylase [Bordetella sp. 15P40C-2]MVW72466.1 uracil-DNA glycosylase [Bordetella sp. 15P40C-2]